MTQQSTPARRGLLFIMVGIAILGAVIGLFLDQEPEVPAEPVTMPPLPLLILGGILVVIGLFVFVVRTAVAISIRRTLDEAFSLMSLQLSHAVLGLRSYQGEYNGFQVEVAQLPGPALSVQVRGQFGSPARIRLGSGGDITFPDANLTHLSASSPDEAWVRTLLSEGDARDAILGLLGDAGIQGTRWIAMNRQVILTYLAGAPVRRVTAEDARQWVYRAVDLAKAAQELAPESAPDTAPESAPTDLAPVLSAGSQAQRAIVLAIALAIAALGVAIFLLSGS